MSKDKRINRSAGFIATLAIGIVLLAVTEGAGAEGGGGRDSDLGQAPRSNVPRPVPPLKLTAPRVAGLPTADEPLAGPSAVNPLAGRPLRYLIGADSSGP